MVKTKAKVTTFSATPRDLEMLEVVARYHGTNKSATLVSLVRREFWRAFPGGTDKLVTLGPLSITREGLTFGLISAGRVLVAFLASVAVLFTTLADDMLEALIARGASHRIAFVVLSAVQLVPRMRTRAGAILEAQLARGLSLEGSFVRRILSLVPLIGPVLLGSLVDARVGSY